ncbi:hypothetical protein PFICI_04524 [Pestalotiopsis fici W106-1]|uniref:Zn(2)-C6 fungal-type domain-containing protein n=1 Tax=Pestalotiopsis fici (strain W106-1 / CGMCC3.15140) TaxID=1229662 RepID=W3X951_PESFW|nr:uncharacterized protein PFICI_04524 [Pestalotiopsis fici W106-1]ETS82648.1 hypothetical protein PFICI_04524 [Pestalotiopsis fici W106-1]
MSDGSRRAFACQNCKRSKVRCHQPLDDEPCIRCARIGKQCNFILEPIERTPLKRKNLDAAELRCSQLETLLRSLNPDLDIEESLAKLNNPAQNDPSGNQSHYSGTEADQEGEDGEARYEWHEDSSLQAAPATGNEESPSFGNHEDGMGAFSTSESGYLGSSSGSSLLQEIATLLPTVLAGTNASLASPSKPSPSVNEEFDRPDLASSAVASLFIDAYFLFYNTSYPVIHEKTFRRKAASDWRRTKRRSTWSIMYYMVLAIGHWVSATDHTTVQTHSPYYSAARSRMSISMLESGTIETLQAFLLMGNYLQKRDRPNTAYNLMGIAYRIAFGLGLHREIPNAADTMIFERRRQLFWTTYCFDSGFNITTGRPPTAADVFFDTRLPRNVEHQDNDLGTGIVREVDHPTPYSAIVAQAELARIASELYSEFLMAKTAGARIEYQVAEAIDGKLMAWKDALPGYFASTDVPSWFLGPRSMVLWKQQNLRILLWRGSKLNHPFVASRLDAERRCVELAMQTIHDVASFCEGYESMLHLGLSWYATYFLFQATLILEVSRIGKESPEHFDLPAWEISISRSRSSLGVLAKKNSSATRCLEIIDSIQRNLSSMGASQPNHSLISLAPQGHDAPEPVQNEQFLIENMFTDNPVDDATLWQGYGFNDGDFNNGDPTIRMLIDQTPLDFLDGIPRDMLFSNPTGTRYG